MARGNPRPIVAIRPDGHCRHFPTISAAARFLKLPYMAAITNAIRGHYAIRGHMFMYEEDWSPRGDYHFRQSVMRDWEGRGTTEARSEAMKRYFRNLTPEQRIKRFAHYGERARKMAADPHCRFAKTHSCKAVYCETNGKSYPSMAEAARELGIHYEDISAAIRRNGKTKGYKFYLQSTWDSLIFKGKSHV